MPRTSIQTPTHSFKKFEAMLKILFYHTILHDCQNGQGNFDDVVLVLDEQHIPKSIGEIQVEIVDCL